MAILVTVHDISQFILTISLFPKFLDTTIMTELYIDILGHGPSSAYYQSVYIDNKSISEVLRYNHYDNSFILTAQGHYKS